jgi:hypothetical protein
MLEFDVKLMGEITVSMSNDKSGKALTKLKRAITNNLLLFKTMMSYLILVAGRRAGDPPAPRPHRNSIDLSCWCVHHWASKLRPS